MLKRPVAYSYVGDSDINIFFSDLSDTPLRP